jgi:hypothetical protein
MKCYPADLAARLEDFARMVSESVPGDFEYLKEKADEIVQELGDGK